MKSLAILLAVLFMSSGAQAGKYNVFKRATKSIPVNGIESSKSLKLKIIDGLDFVEEPANRGFLHRVLKKGEFETEAFTRKVGYAEIKGVTGYYDNGVKNYYLRLELDGYSDAELRDLAQHLHEHGVVRFNTGSKSLELDLLKDLRNTNQLDQRLDDIGDVLVDFFKKTDNRKSMVHEIIAEQRSIYQYQGAR